MERVDSGFGRLDAAAQVALPTDADDKYSRGVVGFVSGSARYPGAAVLGVEAALRTGVGMVRYRGPGRATRLVLQRRPEVVTTAGRAAVWVIGSGQDGETREGREAALVEEALDAGTPLVLDAGALDLAPRASAPVVLTPHAGELARLLGAARADVDADRAAAARRAAEESGAIVLLKGAETLVASPGGDLLRVRHATPWLATAGAGDALAGILGALVATHRGELDLPRAAAAAAWIHGEAARRASRGGPFTILDLCDAIPRAIADLTGGGSDPGDTVSA